MFKRYITMISYPSGCAQLWRFASIWLLGLFLSTLIFRQNVIEQTHTFFGEFDASIQSYAWNTANVEAASHFRIKLWDFTTSSGTSFAGEMQTAPFYPANWFFATLGNPKSVELQEWRLLAHFALAFAGTCCLLRYNKRSWGASVIGAILFAFIGSVPLRAGSQPNIFESLAYLPLVFWLGQRALKRTEQPWRAPEVWLAGFAWGMMILAGHLQPPIHAGLALALWMLMGGPSTPRDIAKRSIALACMGLVAIMVASPQLAATAEYLHNCYRWIGAENPTAPPHTIPYYIYAFKYILNFSDWRSLIDSSHTGAEGATLHVGLIGLALVLIGAFRPGRVELFAIAIGVLAVLVAMGDGSHVGRLSYYTPFINMVRQPVRILCLFHLGAAILAAGGVDKLVTMAARYPKVTITMVTLLACGAMIEACRNASMYLKPRTSPLYPANYYGDKWLEFHSLLTKGSSAAPFRLIALPNEQIPPNLGNLNGCLSTRGHRATMQLRYYKYLERDWSPSGDIFRRLGLRYIFTDKTLELPMISSHNNMHLYERPDALSIFQIMDGSKVRSAHLRNMQWSDNWVKVNPAPSESGRLIFAQVAYPGWHVYIDGKTADMDREDQFLAVNIPLLTNEVKFMYRPAWLWPTATIAICGTIFTLLLQIRSIRFPN